MDVVGFSLYDHNIVVFTTRGICNCVYTGEWKHKYVVILFSGTGGVLTAEIFYGYVVGIIDG